MHIAEYLFRNMSLYT